MFGAFVQASRTPDLRRKLLFTLFIIAAFRLGSFIPTPGVGSQAVQRCMAQESETSLLDLINLFSGGALLQLSIFTPGIVLYIAVSIIIQLLRVVIPRFDDLHKEGQTGQARLTQYTHYLTVFLGILQAITMVSLVCSGQLFQSCNHDIIKNHSVMTSIMIVIVMMAGTGVIMWLGKLITERGIGDGISLLIFTSIATRLPEQLLSVDQAGKWDSVTAIVALLLLVMIAVVYVEQAQRCTPIQHAKCMTRHHRYGSTTTYIPLRTNMSGAIPIIFASSILALLPMAVQLGSPGDRWVQQASAHSTQDSSFCLAIYVPMTLFFIFFYTVTTFNPGEVVDNIKEYGDFILGYRTGRPMAEYLRYVISRITTAGTLYLVIITLLPPLAIIPLQLSSSQMPFDGTTLPIIIGVGLQTVKEISTQLQQHHYEGFPK